MNKERKNRKLKKVTYHLRNIFLLTISVFFVYGFVTELSTTLSLKKDIQEANELAVELEKEKKDLVKQQEMLKDPNYVINYVKGKLLISQDGEQIFSFDNEK